MGCAVRARREPKNIPNKSRARKKTAITEYSAPASEIHGNIGREAFDPAATYDSLAALNSFAALDSLAKLPANGTPELMVPVEWCT